MFAYDTSLFTCDPNKENVFEVMEEELRKVAASNKAKYSISKTKYPLFSFTRKRKEIQNKAKENLPQSSSEYTWNYFLEDSYWYCKHQSL